jgi:hypothetical protein
MKILFYIFIIIVELILSLGFIIIALGTSTIGNRHFYNENNFGYMFFELGMAFTYTIFWALVNYIFLTQIPWFDSRKNKFYGYLWKFTVITMLIFTLIMIDSIVYFKQKNKNFFNQIGLTIKL